MHTSRTAARVAAWALSSHSVVSAKLAEVVWQAHSQDLHAGAGLSSQESLLQVLAQFLMEIISPHLTTVDLLWWEEANQNRGILNSLQISNNRHRNATQGKQPSYGTAIPNDCIIETTVAVLSTEVCYSGFVSLSFTSLFFFSTSTDAVWAWCPGHR